jgi:5-methylcytosine-specific restriction endonuclease McrA
VYASVLNTKVLVLNRSYLPVHITVVRRAISLLYQGIAHAVDDQYRTFDFDTWAPRVILLLAYDRVPRRYVRFSRYNIYARDQNRCQYCGKQFPRAELNLDHVVPRSKGGASVWENVVCSCHRCNRLKGGRTPAEAGIRLVRQPRRPRWTPFMTETFSLRRHKEWLPFLSAVDAAYWNVELVAE